MSATETKETRSQETTIDPREAARRVESGSGVLIDVRTPAEFREIHAEAAINHPLDSLDPREVAGRHTGEGERQEIMLICRSGNRSQTACQAFRDIGLSSAVSVDGGTLAWESAELPVVRGRKAVSLDRQMRITAGSLVVLGAILGATVHPAGYLLSALIGAGLIYAGVSDSCPMSSGLAKMPWNR